MLRCNWNDVELEERYGGKGFWHDRQVVFTKPYNNYMVEVSLIRDFHDNGTTSKYWSIHLVRYNDKYGWAEETYCLDVIFTITELWQYVAGLQLDSAFSAIQTARNPWCEILVKALEQNQLWVEQNNQVITFEPDFDEFVIEVWSQYRLNNGALTTMSYCANIWEDELPVNIRKAVFGV